MKKQVAGKRFCENRDNECSLGYFNENLGEPCCMEFGESLKTVDGGIHFLRCDSCKKKYPDGLVMTLENSKPKPSGNSG